MPAPDHALKTDLVRLFLEGDDDNNVVMVLVLCSRHGPVINCLAGQAPCWHVSRVLSLSLYCPQQHVGGARESVLYAIYPLLFLLLLQHGLLLAARAVFPLGLASVLFRKFLDSAFRLAFDLGGTGVSIDRHPGADHKHAAVRSWLIKARLVVSNGALQHSI